MGQTITVERIKFVVGGKVVATLKGYLGSVGGGLEISIGEGEEEKPIARIGELPDGIGLEILSGEGKPVARLELTVDGGVLVIFDKEGKVVTRLGPVTPIVL